MLRHVVAMLTKPVSTGTQGRRRALLASLGGMAAGATLAGWDEQQRAKRAAAPFPVAARGYVFVVFVVTASIAVPAGLSLVIIVAAVGAGIAIASWLWGWSGGGPA
jgi:hypothetical protein